MHYKTTESMKKKPLYLLLLVLIWAAFFLKEPVLETAAILGTTFFIMDQLGVFTYGQKG